MRALRRDPALRYAQVFKNEGAAAGASLEHCHSQIIAVPFVPPYVGEKLAGGAAHFAATGRCVACDLIATERADGRRVVRATDGYVVASAFAARLPFETWVLPTRHASHFEEAADAAADELGDVLHDLVNRLERATGGAAFNLMVQSSPFGPARADYHWHVELLPRTVTAAGFEWGTGLSANHLPPEEAARLLR